MNNNNINKVIAILSLIFIIAGLLIAHNHPATGYELDIYESTPLFTWIFIILALFGGASIVVGQIDTNGSKNNRIWLLGLLIIILSKLSFLYIPYVRNYITWHGDNITHWGYLRDIIETGHLSVENYYPITHSIISQIQIIADIPIRVCANLSTGFLSISFIVFIYLLSTVVLHERGQQLLATAISGVVMLEGNYDVLLIPNGWSILFLPLVFYLFFKQRTEPIYVIPFIIILVMFPLFHPLSGLMIIIALVMILASRIIINLAYRKSDTGQLSKHPRPILLPLMLEFVVFVTWILSFNRFVPNMRTIWKQITLGRENILGEVGDTLSKIDMQGFDVLVLYIKLYGMQTVLIIFSLIGVLFLIKKFKNSENKQQFLDCLYVGVIFISYGALYFLYYLGMPGLDSVGAVRIIRYAMIFTPVLSAIALYKLCKLNSASKRRYLVLFLLLLILAIPSGMSLINLYYSPYNINPSLQITEHDMFGMSWFFTNKDITINCTSIMGTHTRLADAILGINISDQRADITREIKLANHFGYETHNTLGEQYLEDEYATISQRDRIIYSTVWAMVGRFNAEDFNKLDNDITADKCYSNGELDVYYINNKYKK